MNVIFLDIDHVLNDTNWFHSDERYALRSEINSQALSPRQKMLLKAVLDIKNEYVERLLHVTNNFDIKIVICSSWRNVFSREELQYIFNNFGIQIHDVCERGTYKIQAIERYLLQNKNIKKWCVIDDCIDVSDAGKIGGTAITPEDGLLDLDVPTLIKIFQN